MYIVLQTKKHVVMIASQLKMTTIAIQNKTKITISCMYSIAIQMMKLVTQASAEVLIGSPCIQQFHNHRVGGDSAN